ncbi:Mediator of RNA polymerase II transcription subunit 15a [Spatholobus suberectus]|nr:Mediator of RNA polymerase II transcription subunit 15a [Spatholobus suberectus]
MNSNNWRPNQGTNLTMDTSDWRAQLSPESRQRIVNRIFGKRRENNALPSDYLRKISLKMLPMETKSRNTLAGNMPSNQVGSSDKPPDQG